MAGVRVEEAVGRARLQTDTVNHQLCGSDVVIRLPVVGSHDVAAVALVRAVRTVSPLVTDEAKRLAVVVRTARPGHCERVTARLVTLETGGAQLGALEQVAAACGELVPLVWTPE